jgi:hypothetical protein
MKKIAQVFDLYYCSDLALRFWALEFFLNRKQHGFGAAIPGLDSYIELDIREVLAFLSNTKTDEFDKHVVMLSTFMGWLREQGFDLFKFNVNDLILLRIYWG